MPGVSGRSGGHNAKTVQDHELTGTRRKDRHSHASPEAPKGRPAPPKDLDGEALEEWERMCDRLAKTKVMSKVDDAAIYQYCRLFAETEALAVLRVETGGSVDVLEENLAGLKGADLVACFQEITKLRKLEASYATQVRQGRMAQRVFLVEFGLTPASRGRVKLPDESANKDPFGEFDVPTEH